jgi:hypothetical protein
VINIEMADLAKNVFKLISNILVERAAFSSYSSGKYEKELEANRMIYDIIEGLGVEDYEQAVKAEQEAYETYVWELYNKIGHHEH